MPSGKPGQPLNSHPASTSRSPACGSANEIRTEYDHWNATFLPSAERRIDSAQGATLTTTYDYDPAGRLVSTENGTVPDSASTTLTVTTRTDISYDSRRNPARETLSAASGAAYTMLDRAHDGQGRLTCEARWMNREAFPPLSLGACSPGAAGTQGPDRITRNEYDAAG